MATAAEMADVGHWCAHVALQPTSVSATTELTTSAPSSSPPPPTGVWVRLRNLKSALITNVSGTSSQPADFDVLFGANSAVEVLPETSTEVQHRLRCEAAESCSSAEFACSRMHFPHVLVEPRDLVTRFVRWWPRMVEHWQRVRCVIRALLRSARLRRCSVFLR